jgi:hypothetical protein
MKRLILLSVFFSTNVFSQTSTPSTPVATVTAAEAAKPEFTKQKAVEVLKTAEKIRSLDKAEIGVTLTSDADGKTTKYDLQILRSKNRAYVEFLTPEEERGRKMLAVEHKYYSKFADSKKVVTISPREMLGNSVFAIADLFQLDADKDYDPTIIARETYGGVPCLKLELLKKHDEAPYARIIYIVEEKGYFPVVAQFFSETKKHLKTMTVEKRKKIAGRLRPELLKMKDEVVKDKVSFWLTKTMVGRDIPDQVFTKEYLGSK